MKNFCKNFFLLFTFAFSCKSVSAQLTVTPVTNLQQAVQNSLLGAGVVVNNVTYTGVDSSLAEFSGSSSMGILNGLFIGTGKSTLLMNNVASYFMSDAAAGPGDPDLQTIASGTTQDAGVLEFDFKVQGDSVKFNFVFASEEYSDYAGSSFNDVFGFFISGPGITGSQNIALIPGTSINVSINNVNNGFAPMGIAPTGPCMNCAYYNDNTTGTTCIFDGMTTVLTATAAVQPCTFYHIKLAVANVNDGAFDSGVFLEANSFTPCGPLTVFEGLAPVNDTISMCPGDTLTLTSCKAPNYLWITGDTTQSISVTQPGNYSLSVSTANCFAASSMITVIADTVLGFPQITQNGNVLNSSVTNVNFIYEWFQNGISISGSNNPSLTVSTGGCYQLLITNPGGCSIWSDTVCMSFTGIANSNPQTFACSVNPNPVTGNARIVFENSNRDLFKLVIVDISGKTMLTVSTHDDEIVLMNPNLPAGIYYAELENDVTKAKARTKFIVQK